MDDAERDALWNEVPDPPRHFDRQGEPITLGQWADYQEDDHYKIVQRTIINHRWFVSTVWIGIDLLWFPDRPYIFETMVFDHGPESERPGHDVEMERYSTEAEARAGHDRMVQLVAELEGAGGTDRTGL